MLKQLRNIFFAGLIVLLPIMLTFVGLRWLANTIDNVLADPIAELLHKRVWGLGIIGVVVLILVAGLLSRYFLGRKLLEWADTALLNIPVIKGLYGLLKQVTDSFLSPGSQTLSRVCLVEYPAPGMYRIGFVTGTMESTAGCVYSIFLPTTPNPTAGWVVVMPADSVTMLDGVKGEDAMKLLVSAGVLALKDEGSSELVAAIARREALRRKDA